VVNPLGNNPLRTRSDVQNAVRACYEPLLSHVSPGGARVRLRGRASAADPVADELEGWARPLWGLAPLAAGGGDFDHWPLVRKGLVAGTDPGHPEFWGVAVGRDQRLVEMAAVGVALVLAPSELWDPLSEVERGRVAEWLSQIDRVALHPNNWQFFRVLVDLGLARVGVEFDADAHASSLARIDYLYLGDGWYIDGPRGQIDWYVAMSFHTYGLIYAASGLGDEARADQFRRRAREAAPHLEHWFAPDGASLPYGRSMTYRFAHAAFWAALVLGGEESIGWGRIKGLYLRHLRHWSRRTIAHDDGVLALGYGYPSERLLEPYSSPGSPYWAMKAFLAAAVPDDHPFWLAEEEPLGPSAPATQVRPGFVIARDDEQTLAVAAGQPAPEWVTEVGAKYQRFAYSSRFGFTRGVRARSPERGFGDSTMWLIDASGVTRTRDSSTSPEFVDGLVAATWRPWPDVWVDTVLWVAAPWHGRLHRIRTARPLQVHESGFALGLPADRAGDDLLLEETDAGVAVATSSRGRVGLLDPSGVRIGRLVRPDQGSNLEWPVTVAPVLDGELDAGTHDLATLVFGSGPAGIDAWAAIPAVPDGAAALLERRAPRWSVGRTALNGMAARATGMVSRARRSR
jgi:hypothetical protein